MEENSIIMVIEDYDIDYFIIKNTLENSNIENKIVRFKDGSEAFEYLSDPKNIKPIIIILDILMPVMNGIKFLEKASKNNLIQKSKVIVLTSSKEDKLRIKSFNIGAVGFLKKPFDIENFFDIFYTLQNYN